MSIAEALSAALDILVDDQRPPTKLLSAIRFEPPAGLEAEVDTLFSGPGNVFRALRAGQATSPASGAEARDLLNRGWSLQVENVERCLSSAAKLCRLIDDRFLLSRGRANLYISPPLADPAFDVHHDTTDIIVLQVAGSKRWKVWSQTLMDPSWRMPRSMHFQNPPNEQLIDHELDEGAVLAVRRGDPHAACASQTLSIHFTMAVIRPTAVDVALDAVERLSSSSHFRSSIAWDCANRAEGTVAELRSILNEVSSALAETNPNALLADLRRARTSAWAAGTSSLSSLGFKSLHDRETTAVTLTHPMIRHARIGADELVVAGTALKGPSEQLDMAERLLSGAAHGWVSVDDVNQAVVGQLMDLGVVRARSTPSTPGPECSAHAP